MEAFTQASYIAPAAEILKAMGNPKRLAMLLLLADREFSVNELCIRVDLGQSAASQHLARLRSAGLVETRRDAQTIYYSLTDPLALELLGRITGYYNSETARLDAMTAPAAGSGKVRL